MSEPRSALEGAGYEGSVSVRDAGVQGMIAVRGALAELGEAVRAASGQAVPERRRIEGGLGAGAAWASPDELLLMMPYADAAARLETLRAALEGRHHLAADVSDARAVFSLAGPCIRDVLAKLCPADLSPEALPVGEFRRSHVGQVAAAFWFVSEDEAVLICFRSVADYVFELLKTAAEPGGELGHYRR